MAEEQFEPIVKLELRDDTIDEQESDYDGELETIPEPEFVAVAAAPVEPIKHRQGKPLHSGEKIMAYNIYQRYRSQEETKTRSVYLTARDVGIAKGTMWKIVGEMEKTGHCSSPPTTRRRPEGKQLGRKETLDENDKNKIRQTFDTLFTNNEVPTVDKVLMTLQNDEEFPSITRTTLYRYLKKLGCENTKQAGPTNLLIKRKVANTSAQSSKSKNR